MRLEPLAGRRPSSAYKALPVILALAACLLPTSWRAEAQQTIVTWTPPYATPQLNTASDEWLSGLVLYRTNNRSEFAQGHFSQQLFALTGGWGAAGANVTSGVSQTLQAPYTGSYKIRFTGTTQGGIETFAANFPWDPVNWQGAEYDIKLTGLVGSQSVTSDIYNEQIDAIDVIETGAENAIDLILDCYGEHLSPQLTEVTDAWETVPDLEYLSSLMPTPVGDSFDFTVDAWLVAGQSYNVVFRLSSQVDVSAIFGQGIGAYANISCSLDKITVTFNGTPPAVTINNLTQHDPNNPGFTTKSTITIAATATDPVSGIVANSYQLQYRQKSPSGNWTGWSNYGAKGTGTFSFAGQGGYTYGFRVTADSNAGFTMTSQESYVLVDTSVPTLTNATASPHVGVAGSQFTFRVKYYDAGGGSPLEKQVILDGVSHEMSLESGSAANGTYVYRANLSAMGQHNYTFFFADAIARFVQTPMQSVVVGTEKSAFTFSAEVSNGPACNDYQVQVLCPDEGFNSTLTGDQLNSGFTAWFKSGSTVYITAKEVVGSGQTRGNHRLTGIQVIDSTGAVVMNWTGDDPSGQHSLWVSPNWGDFRVVTSWTYQPYNYQVSGHLVDQNGAALSNVLITLTGGQNQTTTTDASGNWSFANVAGGAAYKIIPTLEGYVFTPQTLVYDDLTQNYTTLALSARVLDPWAPTITLVATPPAIVTDTTHVRFEWTGSDNKTASNALTYQWRLNAGAWSDWSSATSVEYDVVNGTYLFEVTAKDSAGNVNKAPTRYDFVIIASPCVTQYAASSKGVWLSQLTLQTPASSAQPGTKITLLPFLSGTSDADLVPVAVYLPDGTLIGANELVASRLACPTLVRQVSNGYEFTLPAALPAGQSVSYYVQWGKLEHFGWGSHVNIPSGMANSDPKSAYLDENGRLWRIGTRIDRNGPAGEDDDSWVFLEASDPAGSSLPETELYHALADFRPQGAQPYGTMCQINDGYLARSGNALVASWPEPWYDYSPPGVSTNWNCTGQSAYDLNTMSALADSASSPKHIGLGPYYASPAVDPDGNLWVAASTSGSNGVLFVTKRSVGGTALISEQTLATISPGSADDYMRLSDWGVYVSGAHVWCLYHRYWEAKRDVANLGQPERSAMYAKAINLDGSIYKDEFLVSTAPLGESTDAQQEWDATSCLVDGSGKLWISLQLYSKSPGAASTTTFYYKILNSDGSTYVGLTVTSNPRCFLFCDSDGLIWAVENGTTYLLRNDNSVVATQAGGLVPNQSVGAAAASVATDGYRLYDRWSPMSFSVNPPDGTTVGSMLLFGVDDTGQGVVVSNLRLSSNSIPVWSGSGSLADPVSIDIMSTLASGNSSFSLAQDNYFGGGVLITFAPSLNSLTPDQYEDDNAPERATQIGVDGVPQTHSINVTSDVDWVYFTIAQKSSVTIETNGVAGDTRMWLYGPSSSTNQLDYNNDGDNGLWSKIVRSGSNALVPGTYYVKIDQNGNNNVIDNYTISVTARDAVPPTAMMSVNGGQAQRSVVSSISVQFSKDVSGSISVDALVVQNKFTGAFIASSSMAVAYDLVTNTATWTFPGLSGGSLPDGDWVATLLGTRISDAVGNLLDGNGDGAGGDDCAAEFHRFFGDINGDRYVGFADLSAFRAAYQKASTDQGYSLAFDVNGDGYVGFADLSAFRANYQKSLASPATLSAQVNPTGAGTVTVTPSQAKYHCGDTVTICQTATPGYTFSGWTVTGGAISGSTLTVLGNVTLTAEYSQDSFSGTEAVTGGMIFLSNNGPYTYGQVITLTASALSGYAFSGWSVTGPSTLSDSAAVSTSLTVYDDFLLSASFTVVPSSSTVQLQIIGSVQLPLAPRSMHVSISPSGQTLFVPAGSGTTGMLYAISTSGLTITGSIVPGYSLTGVAISPDGSVGYVTNTVAGYSATKFDPVKLTITGNVGTGVDSSGVVFSPDGNTVYTTNDWSSVISIITVASNTNAGSIGGIDSGGHDLAITPDGQYIYAVGRTGNLYKVSTATKTVVATIIKTFGSGDPQIKMMPDGQHFVVTGTTDNTLHLFSTATDTEIATVDLGSAPAGVDVASDGRFIAVTLPGKNEVRLLAAATYAQVASVTISGSPVGLVFSPDGSFLYVASSDSKTVTAIHVGFNVALAANGGCDG